MSSNLLKRCVTYWLFGSFSLSAYKTYGSWEPTLLRHRSDENRCIIRDVGVYSKKYRKLEGMSESFLKISYDVHLFFPSRFELFTSSSQEKMANIILGDLHVNYKNKTLITPRFDSLNFWKYRLLGLQKAFMIIFDTYKPHYMRYQTSETNLIFVPQNLHVHLQKPFISKFRLCCMHIMFKTFIAFLVFAD